MNFPVFLLLPISNFILCGQRRYLVWDWLVFLAFLHPSFLSSFSPSFFLTISWCLTCGLPYVLCWKLSHVYLKRMYILLLLGIVGCAYLLDLVGLLCCYTSSVFLLTFCLVVLSIIVSGLLKSPTVIVELSISSLNYVSFCFIYFLVCH